MNDTYAVYNLNDGTVLDMVVADSLSIHYILTYLTKVYGYIGCVNTSNIGSGRLNIGGVYLDKYDMAYPSPSTPNTYYDTELGSWMQLAPVEHHALQYSKTSAVQINSNGTYFNIEV